MDKDYEINLDKYGEYPRDGKNSFIKEIDEIEDENVVIVFFGTQTGTSEEFSTTFTEELTEKFNIQTLLFDIEDYDMSELLELPIYCESKGKKVVTGFFMSTYGEGEPTDNSIDFWEWIQNCVENDETEDKPLKDLYYFIFGLGNKTYEFYNHIGRELKKAMDNWGGSTILGELGEGDDDEDIENDFQNWKEKMYPIIIEHLSASSAQSNEDKEFIQNYIINFIDNPNELEKEKAYIGEISRFGPRRWSSKDKDIFELNKIQDKTEYDVKHPFYGKIQQSKQLFNDCYDVYSISNEIREIDSMLKNSKYCKHENNKIRISRECLHFDIDISGSNLSYSAGDHVAIYPINDEKSVNELIEILGVTEYSNTFFTLKKNPKSKSHSIPNISIPCTIKTALTYYLDINMNCKTRQLEIILNYVNDEEEKKYILNLIKEFKAKSENIEKYQKTILQILKECPKLKLPIEVVLGELLPRVIPRYYSISSSSKINPNILSVTAVVVRYSLATVSSSNLTIDKMVYKEGLCTGYLNKLHQINNDLTKEKMIANLNNDITDLHPPELMIPISIRESTFKLPRDVTLPVIMIGPGTGIAPFRGFIQERKWQADQGKNVGKTLLFYGCRNRNQDYLYSDEIESLCQELQERKNNNNCKAKWFDFEVIKAFSREADKKVYVQHRILEYGQLIWELLREKRSHLYICGDASNMAKDVHSVIITIAKKIGGMGENQANEFIKDLKLRGRFHEDVW